MGALAGLKIIEMFAIGPVPLAGMLLADMGAEVVILDKADDPFAIEGDITRRGKRAIELDLKSAEDVALAKSLIQQADILLEGYRPGVMERLGLGPDEFLQTNPALIYGRMTGWGQTGPLAQTAGHDINYIALTGALYAMGRADSPPPPPLNLVGDYGGGTMFLVMGVLAALHERNASGQGQVIDAAITEGTANLMSLFYNLSQHDLWNNKRASNLLDSGAFFYDTYATSDAKFIAVGAIEPQFLQVLVEKLGMDKSVLTDQYEKSKWPQLKEQLANIIASKSQQQWIDLLQDTDACVAPVLDYTQAPQHPHMQARQAYVDVEGNPQPAPAPRFSRTPSQAGAKYDRNVDQREQILKDWDIG